MRFKTFALLLFVGLQVSAASQFRILEDCDETSPIITEVAKDATVTVHHSIAGATTWYSVSAVLNGKTVSGYILGRGLDAVEAFESRRMQAERESFRVVLPIPVTAPVQRAASNSKVAPAPATEATKGPAKPAKAPKTVQNVEI